MNSVRERALREIVTRLASAIAPTPVLRMPAVPVTREASPALLLFVDGDSITAHANHLVDRMLIVRLAVVARGADAFDVADQALVAAHAAMLADPNLGGLANSGSTALSCATSTSAAGSAFATRTKTSRPSDPTCNRCSRN